MFVVVVVSVSVGVGFGVGVGVGVGVRVFESDDESLLERSRWKSLSRKLVVGNEDKRTGTVQDGSYVEMQRVRSEDGSAAVKKNRVEGGG